jgi:tagatose 6-phosphate kinase
VPTLLDTSGTALGHGIAAGPDVVKPNLEELAALTSLETQDGGHSGTSQCPQMSTIMAAAAVREGALAVVVSLGPDGLLAVTGEGCWQARPAPVLAGNATGAGDAATAALAHGLLLGRPWPERLAHAAALGAATVAAPVAGEFSHADYTGSLGSVTVTELTVAHDVASAQTEGER